MIVGMQQISEQETKTLVELLRKCQPGNLPREVFEVMGSLMVYTAIELIPLRQTQRGVEVLLLPRDDDDPVWPSMLHTTGTIVRPSDEDFSDAFERLFKSELPDVPQTVPNFVGTFIRKNARGRVICFEYWLEVETEPSIGKFYSVDDLPDNFIPEQKELLRNAVVAFTATKKTLEADYTR